MNGGSSIRRDARGPHVNLRDEAVARQTRSESFPLASALPLAPQGLPVTADDVLRVTLWSSLAGVTVLVSWRILRPDGSLAVEFKPIQPGVYPPTSSVSLFGLTDGRLLAVMIHAESGAPNSPGQTYARVDLVRQGLTVIPNLSTLPTFHLIRSYLYAHAPAVWPGGKLVQPWEGPGFRRTVVGTNPAAGAEILEGVQNGRRWKIHFMRWEMQPSATVIGRKPGIHLKDTGGIIVFQNRGGRSIFNGNAVVINIAAHSQHGWAGDNHIFIPIPPDLVLPGNYTINSFTTSIQSGDDYQAPAINVEEWLEL